MKTEETEASPQGSGSEGAKVKKPDLGMWFARLWRVKPGPLFLLLQRDSSFPVVITLFHQPRQLLPPATFQNVLSERAWAPLHQSGSALACFRGPEEVSVPFYKTSL